MTETKKITINGAGLVGSLLSVLLAKKGYNVDVYDMRPDPREKPFAGGRSINLALSNRGWKALEKAGIADKIKEQAIPMKGRMMHSVDNNLTFQPYGQTGQEIFSVSRSGLNETLITASAQLLHVNFFFNQKCTEVNLDTHSLSFKEYTSGELTEKQYDYLIGTDGAFSAVRNAMQKANRFNYAQEFVKHGYKELHIKPTASNDFALEPNALHIWPRKQFMLIALPNADKSFTATLFLAFEGEHSFENLKTENQIEDFFKNFFPDTLDLLPDLTQQFLENPTGSLVTIKCEPWNNGNTLIMGDAAHAIVPFYGQGMNAGFEDCSILDDLLENENHSLETVFDIFQKSRKKDADAIANLALQNFIEMRDLVADPEFLLRKKIEAKLHKEFPEKWIPLYTMVTFSHTPYAEALAIGNKQKAIMDEVMKIKDLESNWQSIDFSKIEILADYLKI
ncbi:MAG: kynurenine 3-monooxygenase [Thalassobius sp.]|nr:kynurenine 3-monooxygenase [Thalassovita sp.]